MTDDRLPMLELIGVSKSYGGELALAPTDFTILPGEVHALLGENGAGKSTLAKIISGAILPESGQIRFDSKDVSFSSPASASAAGVSTVYQESSLVETMTVAQNMFLGREDVFNKLSKLNARAGQILASQNFLIEPTQRVSDLGAAQKQMVEIARGVYRAAKLVILDEPTASITPEERRQLVLSMERMTRNNVGILFITHNLGEALEYADRITVMRDGVIQETRAASEITRDEIVRLMVGRSVEYARQNPSRAADVRPTLEIDNLTVEGIVQNMSFSAHAGEITAIAGLVGAGRTETARVVFGALKRRRIAGGRVTLNGKRVRFRTPRQAIRHGISYVTEDRKVSGFFSELTVFDNIFMGHVAASKRTPWLATKQRSAKVGLPLIERFNVRALSPARARLVELSGGNQQKVVLAKSLTGLPTVAIFDEPTRGVDVGSISEIHASIRAYADQGLAVIVISSYLPEVLALADRVLVARAGRVVTEMSAAEATEEKIMFAAVH